MNESRSHKKEVSSYIPRNNMRITDGSKIMLEVLKQTYLNNVYQGKKLKLLDILFFNMYSNNSI